VGGKKEGWGEEGMGARYGGYTVIGPKCVLRCSLVVGEGAFVRDCSGIGQMWVLCRVGIVDYLAGAECGGGSGNGMKGRGR
jgi:hypothetical protein